jgi:hypothetical protein
MTYKPFIAAVLAAALLAGCSSEQADPVGTTEMRTSNRTILGDVIYPKWIFDRPEHYEFTPLVSNHDPQNDLPAQWAGQDWDTSKWPEGLTPELAIRRMYAGRIFTRQYLEKKMPVLELGPEFWQLSDLDRRRSIKLVADYTHVFEKGHKAIVLRDWKTKKDLGEYTEKGMFLR